MKELKASIAKSHNEKMSKMLGNGKHPDAKEDKALVKKMVKPDALTGKACSGGAMKRADGGATHAKGGAAKGKGKTNINVVVAPRGGGDRAGMPPVSPMAAAPGAGPMPSRPMPPVAPPPGPGGPAGGLGALKGPMPGGPGPIPAKHGGKIKRAAGGKVSGYDAGAGSGDGRLEKEEHMRKIKGNAAQKAALRRP